MQGECVIIIFIQITGGWDQVKKIGHRGQVGDILMLITLWDLILFIKNTP